MTLEEAVEQLELLGSDEDPISYEGKETTPRDLLYDLGPRHRTETMLITYLAKRRGKLMYSVGTFQGMIRDRGGRKAADRARELRRGGLPAVLEKIEDRIRSS